MKTMTKKSGIATLMAIVMAAALLFAGCLVMPEDDSHGMGTVRVVLGDEIQRSILPSTWNVGNFEAFKFEFTTTGGAGNNAVSETVWKDKGQHNSAIQLADGTYTLIVIAYMDAAVGSPPFSGGGDHEPVLAAAAGVPAGNVVIATNNSNTVNVTLHAYEPSTSTAADTGRFEWDITDGATDVTAASIQVYELDGTTTVGSAVNLLTGANGDGGPGGAGAGNLVAWKGYKNLQANYYYADFTLTVGSGGSAITKHFRHALHVYKNMTSLFTYTFTDDEMGVVVAITSYTLTPNVDYVHPKDGSPEVSVDGTGKTAANGTVKGITLDVTTPTAEIIVTNADDVFGGTSGISYSAITWSYYNDTTTAWATLSPDSPDTLIAGDTFTATRGSAPFIAGGTYSITVTGTAASSETVNPATGALVSHAKSYSTVIIIKVE